MADKLFEKVLRETHNEKAGVILNDGTILDNAVIEEIKRVVIERVKKELLYEENKK